MKKLLFLISLILLLCGCAEKEKITRVDAAATTSTTLATTTTSSTILATTSTTTTSTSTSTTTTTTTSTTHYSLPDLSGKDAPKITVSLNKGTYHSAEQMKIDLSINSPKTFDEVEVRVYGIFAGNRFWLNKTTATNLSMGLNKLVFYHTLPSCNTCAGIAAGTYVVEAEILYKGKAVARDIKSFSLIQ